MPISCVDGRRGVTEREDCVLAALAALPIARILVLMVGARWSAARAGVVGVVVTAILAVAAFGYGTESLGDVGVTGALGGALAESVFTAVTILWIIGPALGIHHLQSRTGGTDVLRLALGRRRPRPARLAAAAGGRGDRQPDA
jgi:lactate permease